MMDKEPPLRRITPLFQPLGYFRYPSGEVRYYVSVRDEIRVYKARELMCMGFLLEMYSYAGYWQTHFPARNRRKVDTQAAAAWFVRECQKAGEIDPPAGLKPLAGGRPKSPSKSPSRPT